MDYAQTKRRDDRPWCGGDVDALDLGAAMIWVMLEAISATHHGWPIFPANCDSDVGVLPVHSSCVTTR